MGGGAIMNVAAKAVEVTTVDEKDLATNAEIQVTPPVEEDGMAKKRARKAKATRAARPKGGRLNRESIFVFKGTPETLEKKIPPRGRAFLNALEKLERGTSDQVAARVTKTDYSGKQDIKLLSRYFLRKLVNVGAVTVEKPDAETTA